MFTEEYVCNCIMPKFSSWLNALEAIYPKKLPWKITSLGGTIFTTMGAVENCESHSHYDNDSLFFVISWFRQGTMFKIIVNLMHVWYHYCSHLNIEVFKPKFTWM